MTVELRRRQPGRRRRHRDGRRGRRRAPRSTCSPTTPTATPATKQIASATQPAHGTVAVAGDGSGLTYKPNPDYCNEPGARAHRRLHLHPQRRLGGDRRGRPSSCADDNPVAVDDTATVAEDADASPIDVLANDTDGDAGDQADRLRDPARPRHGRGRRRRLRAHLQAQPRLLQRARPRAHRRLHLHPQRRLGGDRRGRPSSCADDNPVAVDDTATVAEDADATAIDVLANDTDGDAGDQADRLRDPARPRHGRGRRRRLRAHLQAQPRLLQRARRRAHRRLHLHPQRRLGGDRRGDRRAAPTTTRSPSTTPRRSPRTPTRARSTCSPTTPTATPATKQIASATQPAHGTVAVAGDGSWLTYKPNPDYCNEPGAEPTDDFTYTLNGGSEATVAVTVDCADDDPVAVDDTATVAEDADASADRRARQRHRRRRRRPSRSPPRPSPPTARSRSPATAPGSPTSPTPTTATSPAPSPPTTSPTPSTAARRRPSR